MWITNRENVSVGKPFKSKFISSRYGVLHGFNISRFRVIHKIVKRRFVTNVTKTVTNHSNRVAVIDSNGSFSYEQIYDQAQLIASRLDAKPGMIFEIWVSRILYSYIIFDIKIIISKWIFHNVTFLKSFKGDRFCFLVESGSGQGLMDLSCRWLTVI